MSYKWWQSGTVYQIYPLSFMDSDGDGKGDLQGIRSKLDYLQELGVDAIWSSPIFPSPLHDFGYDVADYTDINPLFGDLAAFDELVADAHARGMKVILDLVPNHTSIDHDWFVEARKSRDNPKRDWYHWRDPKFDADGNRLPPNNWQSFFGGDAWEWDEATGQYYLHLFDVSQPDLNWDNPDVRTAIYDAMRFWFERGVDGFRVDVMWLLIKDRDYRDEPENEHWKPGIHSFAKHHHIYTQDQPDVQQIVREMRSVSDEYQDRVIIGEIYLPNDRLMRYYGEFPDKALDGAHLPFNFCLITNNFDAETVAMLVNQYEQDLPSGAWPNWVLGNHDRPRIASKAGPERAALAMMLLLTLRGTPTIYYGEEIGLENVELPDEFVNDPAATDGNLRNPGRDPERTPMQWDDSDHAGFTMGSPWLPVGPDYDVRNVKVQAADPVSQLSLTKALLALRRAEPALHVGDYQYVSSDKQCFVYERQDGAARFVIALNFDGEAAEVRLPGAGDIVMSTLDPQKRASTGDMLALAPYEGMIVRLD